MSLTGALNTSITGLNVSQTSLALVSQNIANANNPDYKRKVAIQEAIVLDNVSAGVRIAEVQRYVDEFLLREIRNTSADWGRYDAQTPFLDRLQAVFGTPGSDGTIAGRLDRVYAAFETVGTMPDNGAARDEVIFAIESLAREIKQIYDQTQVLRKDVDEQIFQEIKQINAALLRIEELNDKIAVEVAGDNDVSAFLDLRDAQLAIIAERIEITTYNTGDGRIVVMAGSGTTLLDRSAWVLDYQPAAQVAPGTIFSDVLVRQQSAPAGSGTSVARDISSGRLRGLIDLRDVALENTASGLGEFASRVADEINRIHNDNVAFPPPNTLTGGRNTGLLATDPHQFTGQVRFSVIDPSAPTANGYGVVNTVVVDFTAGTVTPDFGAPVAVALTTIGDVIAAVNGANGLNGSATLALTNGVMSLTAANAAHGVGLAQDATTPSDRAGRGFSHFFGLNDLVTSTSQINLEHGFAAGDTHQFTGTTDFTIRDANGQIISTVNFTPVAGNFTSLVTQLNTALTVGGISYATFAIDATTGRVSMTENFGSTVLVRDQGPPSAADRGGTGQGLSNLLGLGIDKVQKVAGGFEINPTVAASSNRLALARLQGAALNDVGVTPGDARGAQALAELAVQNVSINAAGTLSARTTTLGNYAGAYISDVAVYASTTQGQSEEFKVLNDTLTDKSQSLTGVNVDEELSKMIVLQNSYSASARMISTITRMYDELLGIAT